MDSKKFSDFSEEEGQSEEDALNALADAHGLGMWDTPGLIFKEDLKSVYGICASCNNFYYCRQAYQNKRAYCNRFEILLMGKDRMIECNKYEGKGQLTLNQMKDIALYVNPSKRKVGF